MSLDFGKLDFAVSFNRLTAFPLDAKSYFESYAAAEAAALTAKAAGSTESTYYFGQTVVVVENNTANLYQIQPDGSLSSVGGDIAINSSVFATDADGSLNLYGFADAVAGAQLVKAADGTLSWVKPDETTIEGLGTAVETLKTDVANITEDVTELTESVSELESKVGDPANSELGTEATGLYAEIERLDEEKANAADVYTKTEVDAKIAAADHLKRKIVEKYEDIQTYIDTYEDEDQYIFMVPNGLTEYDDKYDEYIVIDGKIEPVGSWEVKLDDYVSNQELTTILASYATSSQLEDKVDKVEGSSLVDDELIEKLENLENIQSVNSSDLTVSETGELALSDAIKELIDGKVTAVEGKSLVSNTLITKLETLNANAEENFIKSVDTAHFNVDDVGHLTLNDIPIAKVTGLEDALAQANIINDVSSDFTITDGKVLTLNEISTDKVTGLSDFIVNTNSSISNLESILNDSSDGTAGLVSKVNTLQSAYDNLSNDYVTLVKYNAEVGDLTQLLHLVDENSTIVDEINYINERLRWEDIS